MVVAVRAALNLPKIRASAAEHQHVLVVNDYRESVLFGVGGPVVHAYQGDCVLGRVRHGQPHLRDIRCREIHGHRSAHQVGDRRSARDSPVGRTETGGNGHLLFAGRSGVDDNIKGFGKWVHCRRGHVQRRVRKTHDRGWC